MLRILIILLLSLSTASCQDLGQMKLLADLSSDLKEISGLEYDALNDVFWAINDSGNKAELFALKRTDGSVITTIKIENAKNNDWEDLTISPDGRLFIGDFGNNRNDRKNLAIYIVDTKELLEKSEVTASKIEFSLSDQQKFPPKSKHRNFDIESFYFSGNGLYLITRNRASKFDGTTKVYELPAVPGTYSAEVISSFVTCDKSSRCQVTSAAFHAPTKTVALLAYDKVWLCSEFEDGKLFSGKVIQLDLGDRTQKESICFKDGTTLYIADEMSGIKGGNLYELKF